MGSRLKEEMANLELRGAKIQELKAVSVSWAPTNETELEIRRKEGRKKDRSSIGSLELIVMNPIGKELNI